MTELIGFAVIGFGCYGLQRVINPNGRSDTAQLSAFFIVLLVAILFSGPGDNTEACYGVDYTSTC